MLSIAENKLISRLEREIEILETKLEGILEVTSLHNGKRYKLPPVWKYSVNVPLKELICIDELVISFNAAIRRKKREIDLIKRKI